VVEGARLESVYRGNSIEGSNPSLSASLESTYEESVPLSEVPLCTAMLMVWSYGYHSTWRDAV
jgi:hypothetical protein